MIVLDIAKYNTLTTQYAHVISFCAGWALASVGLYVFHYMLRKQPPPIFDFIICAIAYTLVQVW